jgi:hypothetical protein
MTKLLDLPKEILVHIFANFFQPPTDIANLSRTCKLFYEALNTDYTWKKYSERRFGPQLELIKQSEIKSISIWKKLSITFKPKHAQSYGESPFWKKFYEKHNNYIISQVRKRSNLSSLASTLNKKQNEIYKTFIIDGALKTSFFKNISILNIRKFCDSCPKHKNIFLEELIKKVLGRNDLIENIQLDQLIKFYVEQLPQHRDFLLETVVNKNSFCINLMKEYGAMYRLKDFCKSFPKYKETLLNKLLNHKYFLYRIGGRFDDLKDFCDSFPAYKDLLLEKLLKSIAFFNSFNTGFLRDLKDFCSSFSEYKDPLLKKLLENNDFLKYVDELFRGIQNFCDSFPKYKDILLQKLLDLDNWLNNMMLHELQICVNQWPQYKDNLVKIQLKNDCFLIRLVYHNQEKEFCESFPEYANQLTNKLNDEIKMSARRLKRTDLNDEIKMSVRRLERTNVVCGKCNSC